MPVRRTAAAASVSIILLAALTSCFALPPVPGGTDGGTGTGPGLVGTTWSGTDSDGDSWAFEFQGDGTVGLTYNGDSYDDPSDTWAVSNSTLAIHAAFDDGDVDLTGPVAADSIDLTGTYPGGTFTLTITQD